MFLISPTKRHLLGVVLFFIIAGVWLYSVMHITVEAPAIEVSEPTNFVKVGTLHFPSPESGQAEGTFSYDENGITVTKKIVMDAMSVCVMSNGATSCMAMNVTFDMPFDGRTALVEGILKGDGILIRTIRVVREGEELMEPEAGAVFISWYQAIELFKACQVDMAMQTHVLDVYVDLKDGRKVRAVEPMIDEMFRIIDQTRGECGTFPVATE